ncbi:MAG: hypothetical protein AB9903_36055 [Vulcanimicrobiota bacterium]
MAGFSTALLEKTDDLEKFSHNPAENGLITEMLRDTEIVEINEGVNVENNYGIKQEERDTEDTSFCSSQYRQIPEEAPSSITYEIQKILEIIEKMGLRIDMINDVTSYLLLFPDIMDVLPIICNRVMSKIGANDRVYLQLYNDPEIEDKYLTILIRTRDYKEEFMTIIDALSDDCLKLIENKNGWLIITIDFQNME